MCSRMKVESVCARDAVGGSRELACIRECSDWFSLEFSCVYRLVWFGVFSCLGFGWCFLCLAAIGLILFLLVRAA